MVQSQFIQESINGQTYWFSTSTPPTKDPSPAVYLLPNFDEYIVGYTDRSAVFDLSHTTKLDDRANVLFNHTIVLAGQVVGTWKRTLNKDSVIITPTLFTLLNSTESYALTTAINHYANFLNMSISAERLDISCY